MLNFKIMSDRTKCPESEVTSKFQLGYTGFSGISSCHLNTWSNYAIYPGSSCHCSVIQRGPAGMSWLARESKPAYLEPSKSNWDWLKFSHHSIKIVQVKNVINDHCTSQTPFTRVHQALPPRWSPIWLSTLSNRTNLGEKKGNHVCHKSSCLCVI